MPADLDALFPVPPEVAAKTCERATRMISWFAFRMEPDEINECEWVRTAGPSRVRWTDARRMAAMFRAYCRARG